MEWYWCKRHLKKLKAEYAKMTLEDWERYAKEHNSSHEFDWIRFISPELWNYVDRARRSLEKEDERFMLMQTFACYYREGFRGRPWGWCTVITKCWGCVQASALSKSSLR